MTSTTDEQDLRATVDQYPRMQKTVDPKAKGLPDLMKQVAAEILSGLYKPQFNAEADLEALKNMSDGTNDKPFTSDTHNRLFRSMRARLDGLKP